MRILKGDSLKASMRSRRIDNAARPFESLHLKGETRFRQRNAAARDGQRRRVPGRAGKSLAPRQSGHRVRLQRD